MSHCAEARRWHCVHFMWVLPLVRIGASSPWKPMRLYLRRPWTSDPLPSRYASVSEYYAENLVGKCYLHIRRNNPTWNHTSGKSTIISGCRPCPYWNTNNLFWCEGKERTFIPTRSRTWKHRWQYHQGQKLVIVLQQLELASNKQCIKSGNNWLHSHVW